MKRRITQIKANAKIKRKESKENWNKKKQIKGKYK